MGDIVLHYLLFWRPLGYIFVFIGMALEGDAVLFSAAFLTHQGFFDPGDMAFAVFGGVITGDLLWYRLGASLAAGGRFARWLERLTAPFDDHLRGRLARTIFISKFAYGLHHPIIMRVGALALNLRRFLAADLAATFCWVLIIGGLGYISSASFAFVRHYLRFTEIALFLALAVFLVFWHFVARRSKAKL